ncbi:MAG: serpin family protein [Elusimicrobiota bacterium]
MVKLFWICTFVIFFCVLPADYSPKSFATAGAKVDQEIIDSVSEFSFSLFLKIAEDENNKNVFISPLSVAQILTLTANGAGGKTRQSMLAALKLDKFDFSRINQAYRDIKQLRNAFDPKVRLDIANSLWTDQKFVLKERFLKVSTASYGAKVSSLDFADKASIDAINNWVSENTGGKIQKIVENLEPDSSLVLLNAVYFKGDWSEKFDKKVTQSKAFELAGGNKKQVPMMSKRNSFSYLEESEFQAVELPYGEGRIKMRVFLPGLNSSLEAFCRQLTPANWKMWRGKFSARGGYLELPRFKINYDKELSEILKNLGMSSAFEREKANFSNMLEPLTRQNLLLKSTYIDAVLHKAFVDINEEGAEAAAATSVLVMSQAEPKVRPSPAFTMIVERPFFFAIDDTESGILLFLGLIYNP